MPMQSGFPAVPVETQPFGQRLLDAFWQYATRNPTQKALVSAEDPRHFVTYRDLYLHSLSVAAFLHERGFGHGDMAALVLPNSWEFLELIVGTALRGGGVSGASVLFTDFELRRQFLDCKAKMVFCDERSLDRVLKAVRGCPLIRTVVVVPVFDRAHPVEDLPFGVVPFSTVLATPPQLSDHPVDVDVKRDVLLLPYSSGTTGSPKGVMLSHQSFSTMMTIFTTYLQTHIHERVAPGWDYEREAVILLLPFYHIYGVGVLMQCVLKGQTGLVLNHFDKHVFLRTIQDFKVRYLFLVPPILVLLANDPVVDAYDLSSFEFVLTGAAPTGQDLCDKLYRRLPHLRRIDQAYGMTECSMACSMPFPEAKNVDPDTVGRLLPNFEGKVVDAEGHELDVGCVGEICIRSPTIMLGYLGRPQATAESVDDQGWYHTGDLGRIDERGYVFVVDRLKELIKVKGLQVAPAELEDLLLSMPEVSDAAVIGIPDAAAGEVPRAFVVRKTDRLTEQQVHEYINDKTAAYKHLKGGIEFVAEIPKSAAGKILRRLLKEKVKKAQLPLAKL